VLQQQIADLNFERRHRMNKIRLILTMVVIFVLATFLAFLFMPSGSCRITNLVVRQNPNLFRPRARKSWPPICWPTSRSRLGSVWVYAHGVQDKPLLIQGIRFGLGDVFGGLTVPSFSSAYATQPIPVLLLSKQCCRNGRQGFLGRGPRRLFMARRECQLRWSRQLE